MPIKDWLRASSCSCCHWLIDDSKKSVKGAWAAIFSLPAIVIVCFVRNPQVIVTYTGGIAGTFILFLFPLTMVHYARLRDATESKGENFNKSPFQAKLYWWLILVFATITLVFVLWGIIEGNAGE
jgi:amino acid permease